MARRTNRAIVRLLLALIVLLGLVVACQPAGDAEPVGDLTETPPPGGPPASMPRAGATLVNVSLVDYEIQFQEGEPILAGPIAFQVTNDGNTTHSFRIQGEGTDVSLPNDLQPGETAVLEVPLEAGTYVVTCPISNHADLGMRMEIAVESRS